MTVFIPWTGYESIGGVYVTLAEAMGAGGDDCEGIDEFMVGSPKRIRSYTRSGELWWENGQRVG